MDQDLVERRILPFGGGALRAKFSLSGEQRFLSQAINMKWNVLRLRKEVVNNEKGSRT